MFSDWLEGKGRQPTTWETLIKALEEADFSEVANDLKDVLGEYSSKEIMVVSSILLASAASGL